MVFEPLNDARASEKVIYNQDINKISYINISKYSEQTLALPVEQFSIARTDLNGDNADEFILKSKDCSAKSTLCTYHIVAETDDKIVPLSQIKAKDLLISDQSTNGIRNILAMDNPHNDFNYSIYHWDASQSMYILSIETSKDSL